MKNKCIKKAITGLTVSILTTTLTLHAALVDFNLSPPGTDAAVGLSPLNEVPAVANSTASGDKVLTGIVFDTASRELGFAIGYGMLNGFRDLTGPATAAHIHGPAPTGQNGGVQFDLATFHLKAPFPLSGGLILGKVILSEAQAADLLAGRYYVNLHTVLNPGGELRGQLIPALAPSNTPPAIGCPTPAAAECGVATSLSVLVSDAEGDALTVTWVVNGVSMQTNGFAVSAPGAVQIANLAGMFSLGSNTVNVTVTDPAGASNTCESVVVVLDTVGPIISARVDKPRLWPPNHKLVPVKVSAVARDTCGDASWEVISVSCNQMPDASGAGQTASDWQIIGPDSVLLRAERSSKGGERVYTILLRAVDDAGNQTVTSISVAVPVSMGK